MQNSSVLATRATRKTTRFSVRDAKSNAAGAMHRVAWALQKANAIGQKCEKPLENLWFTSEEDRNRTYACFPRVFEEFERYQFPSTLPLKTTRNRFPLASVYSVVPTFPASVCSVCSVVPTFPASVCSVCSVVPTFPASVCSVCSVCSHIPCFRLSHPVLIDS